MAMMIRQPRARRGFILLVVVLILSITCLMLFQIASIAQHRIRDVVRSESELKQRWSLLSLRMSLLPNAASLLRTEEFRLSYSSGNPNRSFVTANKHSGRIVVNSVTYEFVLMDENAKLSVPGLLWNTNDRNGCLSQIARLAQSNGLLLRKELGGIEQDLQSWFWTDIFEAGTQSKFIQEATSEITLWGDRKLNVYRANEGVLNAVWIATFGHFPPADLQEMRTRNPPVSFAELRSWLALREADLEKFDRMFCGESSCFSMRLTPNDAPAGNNTSWTFVVDRERAHYAYKQELEL